MSAVTGLLVVSCLGFMFLNYLVNPPPQYEGSFKWALKWKGIAHKHAQDGDYQAALECYTKILESEPRPLVVFADRAAVLAKLGRLKEAEADYSKAIEFSPSRHELYLGRAQVRFKLNRKEDAQADLIQATTITPKSPGGYQGRAEVWTALGEHEKALADLNQAIDGMPGYTMAYLDRAAVYIRIGDFTRSLADYESAVQASRQSGRSQAERWVALRNLAEFLSICPDSNIRNGDDALKFATEACEMSHWKDSYSLSTLAAAYAEIGEFDDAVKWQKKATSRVARLDKPRFEARIELYKGKKPFRIE